MHLRSRLIGLVLCSAAVANSQEVYTSGEATDCSGKPDNTSMFSVSLSDNSIVYNISGYNYYTDPVADELSITVGGILIWGTGLSTCIQQNTCSPATGVFQSQGTVPVSNLDLNRTIQEAITQEKPLAIEFHLVDASTKILVYCLRTVVGTTAQDPTTTAVAGVSTASGTAIDGTPLATSSDAASETMTPTVLPGNSTTNGTTLASPTTNKSESLGTTASVDWNLAM